jgi:hypothetical protein
MRTRWLLIGIGAVAVLFVLYGQGYFSGVIGGGHQDGIAVNEGWNQVKIPDNWERTTAKAVLGANPSVTAITYTGSDGLLHSYLLRFADSYSFDVAPGMAVWIYSTTNGEVVAP